MPFKTFLINKIKNQKYRLNGIIPSNRLPNKRRLCQAFAQHKLYTAEQLPPKVDLRPEMTPIEDQSQIGSCSANCLAGAYEYLTKKSSGRNIDVSRLFIYYNGRAKENNSSSVTDSGCSMTDAIEALEQSGVCLESTWPYDIARVNTRPDEQAYQEAQGHKITEALQVQINLEEMKSCLAQGYPFAFGLRLFTSFDKAQESGVVPMPNTDDGGRQSDGSHALLAVGYSDQSNAFIVRNSWGESWGDKGYCYIPYDYLTDTDLCFDVWTIRKVAQDDFGQEHWHFTDAVNYLHSKFISSHRGSDESSRTIESFDEDDQDDSGGNAGYSNNRDDYSDAYGNRNDYSEGYSSRKNDRSDDNYNASYDRYPNDQGNDYDDNRNDYRQDNQSFGNFGGDDFNSDRNDPFRNDNPNYGGYSDYN